MIYINDYYKREVNPMSCFFIFFYSFSLNLFLIILSWLSLPIDYELLENRSCFTISVPFVSLTVSTQYIFVHNRNLLHSYWLEFNWWDNIIMNIKWNCVDGQINIMFLHKHFSLWILNLLLNIFLRMLISNT